MLPLLLAGVLASTPSTADAADCVRRLVSDMGTGAVWALQHPQAFTEAVRFAADPPSLQAALLEVRSDELVGGPGVKSDGRQ